MIKHNNSTASKWGNELYETPHLRAGAKTAQQSGF